MHTETRQENTMTDPIAALIAAHTPTGPAEMLRPLPIPSTAAVEDQDRRARQALHNEKGTPRHLLPVSAIR